MAEKITHIYDKIFKKILTLSNKAVINLINGLFDMDYPEGISITYNWTEFEDDNLKRTLADTLLTVGGKQTYHMEAQLEKDEDIVLRVFEYGYHHADRVRYTEDGQYILPFPEPKVIYLYNTGNIPDIHTLTLDFGMQGTFQYKVPVFKYLETSLEELDKRKMVILIPFQLLRLRKLLEKKRTPENIERLRKLIECDILGSVERNYELGNISKSDVTRLREMTKMLYDHIYAHYDEMEVLNDMTDQSLLLPFDIWEMEMEKKQKNYEAALAEQKAALAKQEAALAEKDSALAEKDSALAEKDSEIARLKAELTKLTQC